MKVLLCNSFDVSSVLVKHFKENVKIPEYVEYKIDRTNESLIKACENYPDFEEYFRVKKIDDNSIWSIKTDFNGKEILQIFKNKFGTEIIDDTIKDLEELFLSDPPKFDDLDNDESFCSMSEI